MLYLASVWATESLVQWLQTCVKLWLNFCRLSVNLRHLFASYYRWFIDFTKLISCLESRRLTAFINSLCFKIVIFLGCRFVWINRMWAGFSFLRVCPRSILVFIPLSSLNLSYLTKQLVVHKVVVYGAAFNISLYIDDNRAFIIDLECDFWLIDKTSRLLDRCFILADRGLISRHIFSLGLRHTFWFFATLVIIEAFRVTVTYYFVAFILLKYSCLVKVSLSFLRVLNLVFVKNLNRFQRF